MYTTRRYAAFFAVTTTIMASYQAVDQKKEDFRKYLEKSGVIDALTKGLVELYEGPEKPNDPLEFLKEYFGPTGMGGTEVLKQEITALKKENADLKAKVADLEKKLSEKDGSS